MFPNEVTLIEVGLRDGLQSEPLVVPTDTKLTWIDALLAAGVRYVQVCSFVHPARVPQMADAHALCERLPNVEGVQFSGLVLNLKGVARAHAAGLRALDMGVSADDAHSKNNMGKTSDEALAELAEMVALAHSLGMQVRAAVQVAFGHLRTGDVPLARVQHMVARYLELGVQQIALADSSGLANPLQLQQVLTHVLPMLGDVPLVLHLHNTRGMGLANVYAALMQGVRYFDTAFGGLGGCPFIKGAAGNIATEDTAHMLAQMGISTGIDVAKVARVSHQAAQLFGHGLESKLYSLYPIEG